jgi:malonyl-CoA O-methyltransferase
MNLLRRFRSTEPTLLDPFEAYELWAETYDDVEHNALLTAEQSVVVPMLRRLKLKGTRILDAGCGNGRYLRILQTYRPKFLAGIDFSPAMIAKARERTGTSLLLKVAPIEAIPFKRASFDFVFSTLALDHLSNLQKGVSELSRVLRKGGAAIISVFHPYGQFLGWQRTFRGKKGNSQTYAVRFFPHTHSEYLRTFRSVRLSLEELLEPVIDEQLKPFYESAGRLDLYERFKGFPVVLVFRLTKQ